MNNQDLSRYSRNILLKEVGVKGQEKLLKAKVLVIGAGGLGCPVLQYITAAGVGTIGIIDFDIVDESNLQRQTLFSTSDVGKNKALCAKSRLQDLNPHINIKAYNNELNTTNALSLFEQFDVIVDGSDNFSTRYLINDACIIKDKPLVYGAINQFDGQVSVFNFKDGPSYRCLFPTPPEPGSIPSCSEAGVLGVLPGIIGSMQANETIKIILDLDGILNGKLLVYNALSADTYKLNISKNKIDAISEVTFEKTDYNLFCGIEKEIKNDNIYNSEVLSYLNNGYQLIDLRESWEQPRLEIDHMAIPFGDLSNKVETLSTKSKLIIACQNGQRSRAAVEFLKNNFDFSDLLNLKEGLEKGLIF